jgi:amino acid permease
LLEEIPRKLFLSVLFSLIASLSDLFENASAYSLASLFRISSKMLLLLLCLTLCSGQLTDLTVKNLLLTYEKSQNTLNATLCASTFDSNATIFLPMGEAPIVGNMNIFNAFNGFFKSLVSLKEVLDTEILIHATGAGYSKTLFAIVRGTNCPVVLPAVQWFVVNPATSLISQMGVVYNTTDFGVQAKACLQK